MGDDRGGELRPERPGRPEHTEPGGALVEDRGEDSGDVPAEEPTPRPLIERLGLALVALVLALLFGGVAAAAWSGGELFLAAMGAIGCLMTVWVGALTLVRG